MSIESNAESLTIEISKSEPKVSGRNEVTTYPQLCSLNVRNSFHVNIAASGTESFIRKIYKQTSHNYPFFWAKSFVKTFFW